MTEHSKTLAQLTPEQTAAWLRGEDQPWSQGIVDPEMRERFDRQKRALAVALDETVFTVGNALAGDSAQTAQRLKEIWEGARRGNPDARRLLATMLGELVMFAYDPNA